MSDSSASKPQSRPDALTRLSYRVSPWSDAWGGDLKLLTANAEALIEVALAARELADEQTCLDETCQHKTCVLNKALAKLA